MRFLMMVKSDERVEAGVLPDEKALSEMGAYNAELIKAGLVQAMDGLKPSREGTRLRLSNGKTTLIDGPFAEAKELLGGFWVISAQSKEEAIDWAKRVPLHDGQVEIRPLYETEDFPLDPAEKPGGWRDQEIQAREQAAAKPPARKPGTRRYMLLLKADPLTEAGAPPTEALLSEMGALMQEITEAGAMLAGDGLKPSSQGARVAYSGDRRKVIDGPFTESKELIAGYAIVQAESKQQAIDWARRMLEIHVRGTGQQTGEVEVREFFEIEDFPVSPEEKPEGWRAIETAFRDRQGA